jgi:hypothetical protein
MEPLEILQFMDAVRAETLKRFSGLTQAQLDWRPPTGEGEEAWSLGEVFMHLAIDEHYLREYIARPLLEGIKPPDGIEFMPPPPPYRKSRDVIAFWFERARTMTRRLMESWPADANLELKHFGGFDEAMNGAEWLMGYAGHEKFHHKQIDALIEQLPV